MQYRPIKPTVTDIQQLEDLSSLTITKLKEVYKMCGLEVGSTKTILLERLYLFIDTLSNMEVNRNEYFNTSMSKGY